MSYAANWAWPTPIRFGAGRIDDLPDACRAAGIEFDNASAHSARYDTERTAELFCAMVNRFKDLGGWDLAMKEQGMNDEVPASLDAPAP